MQPKAADRPAGLPIAFKALVQLGPGQVGLYGLHQIGLRSGYYRYVTGERSVAATLRSFEQNPGLTLKHPLWQTPDGQELAGLLGDQGIDRLRAEAEEIVAGKVRSFGGDPTVLCLEPPGVLSHWTVHARQVESGQTSRLHRDSASRLRRDSASGRRRDAAAGEDIKFTWEPARFGWATILARAYSVTGDERYAESFWKYTEAFLEANPPYLGVHWASGQEAALRLMALTFAWQVFAGSAHSTARLGRRLAEAIALHAARLPVTLAYARAQNNNHLLSEAAGLYTAGLALPEHPSAGGWRKLGWRWFNRGLQSQIAEDGGYIQHSTNYHRLMLHLALWVGRMADVPYPEPTRRRLAAATGWLLELLDPVSFRVPNLGPNDGARILPLDTCPYNDYRPALQAAGMAFLDRRIFPPGAWDEPAAWLGLELADAMPTPSEPLPASPTLATTPHVLRSPDGGSWAYLRAARFTSRPGHADQLHLDLWWRGMNLAQDAGTYRYQAPAPPGQVRASWDNALADTAVHNTVTLDGQSQMRRVGRFLFLDWAQASVLSCTEREIAAQHDGYRRLGITHRRSVAVSEEGDWSVEDQLLPLEGKETPVEFNHAAGQESYDGVRACLHWLLPDWEFEVVEEEAREATWMVGLEASLGRVEVRLGALAGGGGQRKIQLSRAGELIYGEGRVSPIWGWVSPTYGVKNPALSLRLYLEGQPPLKFTTRFLFPD